MLLILLTALMGNSMTVLHHVTMEASTPIYGHHIDAHEEFIREDVRTYVTVSTPTDTGACQYLQCDRQVAKLLYASIFHPPQAS